jgi:hypothetical protein
MWKILGKDAIYLDVGNVAKQRLMELAGDDETGIGFRALMEKSDITFMINGTTEYNSFFFNVPEEYTPEQIQFMADIALKIVTESEVPMVTIEDVEQNFLIIFTNDKEPELLGIRKTPGMSSGAIFKPIIQALDKPGNLNKDFM